MNNKIVIGTYNGEKTYISEDSPNQHILISGTSGFGKTTLIDSLAIQIATLMVMSILRFNWHHCCQRDQRVACIQEEYDRLSDEYRASEGIPLKLFESETKALTRRERELKLDRITEILSDAVLMTDAQRRSLYTAVKLADEMNLFKENGIHCLETLLESQETKEAINAVSKLNTILTVNPFYDGDFTFRNPIQEINVNDFSDAAQAGLIYIIAGHFIDLAKKDTFINKGLTLIIDEVHNLEISKHRLIKNMFLESRKKNVRLIMATAEPVTSGHYMSKDKELLTQCATKCFFKPAGRAKATAELISTFKVLEMTARLNELQRGEFIAVGNLVTESGVPLKDKPIKLQTYIPEPEKVRIPTKVVTK